MKVGGWSEDDFSGRVEQSLLDAASQRSLFNYLSVGQYRISFRRQLIDTFYCFTYTSCCHLLKFSVQSILNAHSKCFERPFKSFERTFKAFERTIHKWGGKSTTSYKACILYDIMKYSRFLQIVFQFFNATNVIFQLNE